jgi:tetratricopeptide (TPR) repeat protein
VRVALWALLAAGFASSLARAAEPAVGPGPGRAVRDPYYGVALFDYFQEHYFSSLSDLMVAGQFDRLAHSTDEAEILRGGLVLSYGLDREAAEIFERLSKSAGSASVRDRAWYYLAKIRFQKDRAAEAEAALARIGDALPEGLQEDRLLLQAQLLMLRGDFAQAAVVLKPLANDDEGPWYARYNLGIALIRSGAGARGSEILDKIGVEPADTEELRSLRDKANVALGFAALQNKDPESAKVYLARVRLSGLMASHALLGLGWAEDSLHLPKDALVPWSELAGRDTGDPAVLEALLAVPYALAEVGASAQSLEYYGRAIVAYDQAGADIDGAIAAIRSGKFLDDLLASNPGDEMGWFWKIGHVPELPHGGHLASVMAQHPFQQAFKNYRDLRFLARNLQDWDGKLAVLDDMLEDRRKAFAQRLPQVVIGQRNAGIGRLDARRDAVVVEIGTGQEQADGRAFADPHEQALAQRLARVRANLAALTAAGPDAVAAAGSGLDAPVDLALAQDRARRVDGALQWQLAQEFPDRLWSAKKSLQQLNEALQQLHLRDAELVGAQANEPQRFDALALRISALRDRVHVMQPRIQELVILQQLAVQDLAVAELEQQRLRLVEYSNQARFAIAGIYDKATISGDAAHAPAK